MHPRPVETFRSAPLRRLVVILSHAALLWLLCAARPCWAHEVPPSLATLDIGRRTVEVELQLPLNELGSALSLPLSSNVSTLIADYGPQITRYVQDRFRIEGDSGGAYATVVESMRTLRTSNANWINNDWLVVQAELRAPTGVSTKRFDLDDTIIVHRVLSHQAFVYVRRDLRNGLIGDEPQLVGVVGFGKTRLLVDGSRGSWGKGFSRLFSLGMSHIAGGTDHLLFLLTLLLPAPLVAARGRWRARKDGFGAFRTIVKVISGFTIGHCLTLGLASMGWIVAPSRVVEVLVAVSILVSSLHAWRPVLPGREVWIASGFGLVHGLAFASTLSGLNFDGTTLALSLLGFNLGIESMQLLVIAATLPLLMALSGRRSYTVFRFVGASFGGVCALAWIRERALQVSNPLQPMLAWLAAPPAWLVACVCAAGGGAAIWLGIRAMDRGFSEKRQKVEVNDGLQSS